ncbi:MAG: DUF4336 domain-containing protein [Deltaproteobacteria bacterium]|nr:DUF4336 domain-containing protein [Deltaproteobacteria bacterium]
MSLLPLISDRPDAGVWSVAHALNAPGGLPIGTRSTVIRRDDGALILHAPGALTPADIEAIRALGPVVAVVAPNREHHLFARAAVAAFPGAQLHAPTGMDKKLAGAPDALLPSANSGWDARFGAALPLLHVGGLPTLDECVLLHKASGTLITTDLVFNLVDLPPSFGATMLRWVGSAGQYGPTNIFKWLFLKDKHALRRSLDQLLEAGFDQVSMCHGTPITGDGARRTAEAFAFLPAGA